MSQPAPNLHSTSVRYGIGGTPYSAQLTATGGSPPYTWSPSSPPGIPGGLSISSSGVVSGTPTTAGTFTFTVTVTDTALTMSSAAVSVTINP